MSYTAALEKLTTKLDSFMEQYENDMRGDKSMGNGEPGLVGAVRSVQKDVEQMRGDFCRMHDTVYGDDDDPMNRPGLVRQMDEATKQMASIRKFVWIVVGAFTTAGIGLILNALLT